MQRWAECVGAARRLVVALAITLLGLLIPASPGFASSLPSQQEAAPYVYDSHHHTAPLNHPDTERGPPSTTYARVATPAAVGYVSDDHQACPDTLIVAGYTTYDVAGTSGHAQVNDGEFLALTGSHTAAKFGSGSGPWADGVGARSGGAVGQATEGSCVSACGAMLSGRSQAALLGKLGDWSNPQALARELGDGWTGGFFGSSDDAIAAAGRGPMGATLQAGTGPGHMVVTSPLGEGRFLVRDPRAGGSTYEVGSAWIGQYVSGGVFR